MVNPVSPKKKSGTSDTIKLNMLGLPPIQTIEDLSTLIHISKNTIYQLSKNADKHYLTYTIPKKNGKLRTIAQPSKRLKGLQSWILVNILNKLKVSSSCIGFEKGSSIADNAEVHKGANSVLTIDLQDFFSTIDRRRVYNIFHSIGYNQTISAIFTNICTYKGFLPQGGPCSPKLANLATWILDSRIQGYVGIRGISYTRYADDLSFSGLHPSKVANIYPMIERIIKDEKFLINDNKTRMSGSARAKKITGLVLHDDTFGIGAKKYKEVRAKIHNLTLPKNQLDIKLLTHVKGWLSYLASVDGQRAKKANRYIVTLSKRHPNTLIEKLI